ncbi:MAG: HisA/HisF-related TIM barrel protein [Planctomycetota bacterium]
MKSRVKNTDDWLDSREQLVGVIDLMNCKPVHAVRGDRGSYKPVLIDDGFQGLVNHYARLGLECIYIADLESILGAPPQLDFILAQFDRGAASPMKRCWVDIGWRGDESPDAAQRLVRIARSNPTLGWILASETMLNSRSLGPLSPLADTGQLCISLDFRDHQFMSRDGSIDDWIDAIVSHRVGSVVALDIATVGSHQSTTSVALCRKIRRLLDQRGHDACRLIGGGGVKSPQDLKPFLNAGCEQVLVATALLPTS